MSWDLAVFEGDLHCDGLPVRGIVGEVALLTCRGGIGDDDESVFAPFYPGLVLGFGEGDVG